MISKNKQTNQKNESDASLTASKQHSSAPANALIIERGEDQTAPNPNIVSSEDNENINEIQFSAAEKKQFGKLRGSGYNAIVARILVLDSGVKPENYSETAAAKANLKRELILRRFFILRQKGFSIEEARIIASHPSVSLVQIENFQRRELPAKIPDSKTDSKTVLPTRVVRVIVKSAIPGDFLNKLELQKTLEEIQIKSRKWRGGTGIKPKFISHFLDINGGWLEMICAGNVSSIWLKKNITSIRPWPGAKLKVMTEAKHEMEIESYEIVGTFPNSVEHTPKGIIRFIGAQNKGLLTKHWQIVNRTVEGTSQVQLTLNVDKVSAEKLKELNYNICYKLGEVKLKIKPNKAGGKNHPQTSRGRSLKNANFGSSKKSSPPNRSDSRNRNYSRFGPNRNNPGPSLNRQMERSSGGSDMDPINRSNGRDQFLRRSDNDNNNRDSGSRGDTGSGSQTRYNLTNSRNFSSERSIPNQPSEFRNTIDEMQSLINHRQPSSNNDYEIFSRKSDNNHPSARENDNYYDNTSYRNTNRNYGDSNFRDLQNDSEFTDRNTNFRNLDFQDNSYFKDRNSDYRDCDLRNSSDFKDRSSNFQDSGYQINSDLRRRNSNFRDSGFQNDCDLTEKDSNFRDSGVQNNSDFRERDSNFRDSGFQNNHDFRERDSNFRDSGFQNYHDFRERDSNFRDSGVQHNSDFRERNSNFRDSAVQNNSDFRERNSNFRDSGVQHNSDFRERNSNFRDSGFQNNSDFRERNSNFRDSGFQNNSDFREGNSNFRESEFRNSDYNEDTPINYGGTSSRIGNSSYRNNSGNSSNSDNFKRPSFQNSSNSFGDSSSNYENSKFDNNRNSRSFGSSRSGVWASFDSNRKSSQNNNIGSGGWQRR